MKNTTKEKLASVRLPLGQSAWVERASWGGIIAKADFHPDDPISTLHIGSPRACFKAVSTVARALRSNYRGRVQYSREVIQDRLEHILSGVVS